jgi:hypothetical protein
VQRWESVRIFTVHKETDPVRLENMCELFLIVQHIKWDSYQILTRRSVFSVVAFCMLEQRNDGGSEWVVQRRRRGSFERETLDSAEAALYALRRTE